MAYFGFTDKLRRNETIEIFNYGNCKRDFTYIDDIVEGVIRVMEKSPKKMKTVLNSKFITLEIMNRKIF